MAENIAAAPAASANTAPSTPAEAPKASAPVVKVDENGVAAEAPKKIWKLKVNGKDVEYDASDEARLQRDIQKVYGIEEKAKAASEKADQVQSLLDMAVNNPAEFGKRAKALGIDAEKLATEIIWRKIKHDEMTPEQRELEEYKEREREAAEQKKADEESAKISEVKRKTQEWAAKFEKDCEVALKASSIPKTRLSLALVAQYIDAGLASKQELSVEQVLPYVARDLKEIHASTMGKLDGEDLLNYIGEELSNKVAKARVARYNKSKEITQPTQKPATNPAPSNKVDLSKLKGKAYWAALRKMKSEQGIGQFPGQQ